MTRALYLQEPPGVLLRAACEGLMKGLFFQRLLKVERAQATIRNLHHAS
jgi:hypothetical protein